MKDKDLDKWLLKKSEERQKSLAWKQRLILGVSGSGFLKKINWAKNA